MFVRIGAAMRHYGGRGTTVVTMVHRVITINEDICYVLCVCCTEDYSTGPTLSADSIIFNWCRM